MKRRPTSLASEMRAILKGGGVRQKLAIFPVLVTAPLPTNYNRAPVYRGRLQSTLIDPALPHKNSLGQRSPASPSRQIFPTQS